MSRAARVRAAGIGIILTAPGKQARWFCVKCAKKSHCIFASGSEIGRGGQIRTDDLYVPNVALYQAKLRPDNIRLTAGKERLTNETGRAVANKIFEIHGRGPAGHGHEKSRVGDAALRVCGPVI